MLPSLSFEPSLQTREFAQGETVLARGTRPDAALYLLQGRVTLGLLHGAAIEHRLGAAEGPCWLEVGAAVLGAPFVVDAVADTPVVLRELPLPVFAAWLAAMPEQLASITFDVARAQRQQAELAVSRLAKDAEARCAEWLLRHAEPGPQGAPAVQLREHKRLIASQLGIAPETFSRVLRHLRERELISGSGRVLSLTDPQGLRSLAGV